MRRGPQPRNDGSTPPVGSLQKPIFVLQMNWWHWSDELRVKWLIELREVILTKALPAINAEIQRLERR